MAGRCVSEQAGLSFGTAALHMGPEGSLISLSQLGQFRGRAVEESDRVWGTGRVGGRRSLPGPRVDV